MSKLLVITGAGRGIGLATAKQFKMQGYRVINLSRSVIDKAIGDQIEVDFSNPQWPEGAATELAEAIGDAEQICLVHNASVLLKDSLQSAAENLAKAMQVNVLASQQLNELLLPDMQAGSSIIYIGSTLSEKAVANTLSYSTSKHAVLGLMRASCQDLAGSHIHTAAVCPGFTDTQMLRDHLGNDQQLLDSIASCNGFNRLIAADEIASAIWYCSQNPVINGGVLHAHLGQREN